MTNLELVDVDSWKNIRKATVFKLHNAHYLNQFNDALRSIAIRYDNLDIRYYEQLSLPLKKRFMLYGEGTPLFFLFKLVPQDYFVYTFKPDHFWKNYHVNETTIQQLLSYDLNKYTTNKQFIKYPFDYILYVAGIQYQTEFQLLEQIAKWSTHTKNHVVVKTHPYIDQLYPDLYQTQIESFYQRGIDKKYFHLDSVSNTDKLVDYSYMVWTILSGVGFQALLKQKPVSYFGKDVDYNYGPIAKFSRSPAEAYENTGIPYHEVKKYFTWYYDKLSVDMHSSQWFTQLESKLHSYFCIRKTPYEYLSA